jgi:hypothetical protein
MHVISGWVGLAVTLLIKYFLGTEWAGRRRYGVLSSEVPSLDVTTQISDNLKINFFGIHMQTPK